MQHHSVDYLYVQPTTRTVGFRVKRSRLTTHMVCFASENLGPPWHELSIKIMIVMSKRILPGPNTVKLADELISLIFHRMCNSTLVYSLLQPTFKSNKLNGKQLLSSFDTVRGIKQKFLCMHSACVDCVSMYKLWAHWSLTASTASTVSLII
jgi:hypothetical protein